MGRYIPFIVFLCLGPLATAQEMANGEYWLDTDPGIGQATPFDYPDNTDAADVSFTIPPSTIAAGMHVIGFRTRSSDARWSQTNLVPLRIVAAATMEPIVRTEYFFNTDPGFGAGEDAAIAGAPDLMDALLSANATGLDPGINLLFTRSQDAQGRWSHSNRVPVLVNDSSTGVLVRMEYFWDTDPGFGMGLDYPVSANAPDLVDEMDHVLVPDAFQAGSSHHLYLRSLDSRGRWSHTNYPAGGDSTTIEISSSVDDLTAARITVYPNPFVEGITVSNGDDRPMRMILYDPQGRLLLDESVQGSRYIDLGRQAAGTYTAFFWKDRKLVHRLNVVKQ